MKVIMRFWVSLLVPVAIWAAPQQQKAAPQQQKKQRDLVYEPGSAKPGSTKPEPPASAPLTGVRIPRSYALVIGISQYKNLAPEHQLRYAERDAQSIYSILISPEGGNFPAENVRRLEGPNATGAAMRNHIEQWLPQAAKDDDRVLIYFAGHGYVHQGKAYLMPYDVNPGNIPGTGYPMDDLGAAIGRKIKGKWKVLLTDSCHSGAISPDGDVQTINRSLLDLGKSLFSLTASRDRERSFESPDWGGGHGIFTYYVVRGMEGAADENRDGIVSADELAEYTRRNVREATKGAQNPTADRASFDPEMLLSWVPTNRKPDAPPPPKFGGIVIEANMDGVEVFLDGNPVGSVAKGTPLPLPGLVPGAHSLKAVKSGYEPDGPREITVYPGRDTTVTVRIAIQKPRKKAAVDAFEEGFEYYQKGFEKNYRKAAELFQKSLSIEPQYSQAALYLARTYNALFDQEQAEKYFRRAVDIDLAYLDARASFAGMLLDTGNLDEAIRQLDFVVQRDATHQLAFYLQSQAYCRKEMFEESIKAARRAIQLAPGNAEAHFFLAQSLRMTKQHKEAINEYNEYLALSNFDSGAAGKFNYYVLSWLTGHGKKRRPHTVKDRDQDAAK